MKVGMVPSTAHVSLHFVFSPYRCLIGLFVNLKSYKWNKEGDDEVGINKNLKNAEIN